MSATEPSTTPTLTDYAAAHGLRHRTASLALPKAFLVFTDHDSYEDMGWRVLVVELRSAIEGLALVQSVP
jgi:hypothetical protein